MKQQTRKNHSKSYKIQNLNKKHSDAKQGTKLKCILKTCRAKKYQSVYGAVKGGNPRSNRQLFF